MTLVVHGVLGAHTSTIVRSVLNVFLVPTARQLWELQVICRSDASPLVVAGTGRTTPLYHEVPSQ